MPRVKNCDFFQIKIEFQISIITFHWIFTRNPMSSEDNIHFSTPIRRYYYSKLPDESTEMTDVKLETIIEAAREATRNALSQQTSQGAQQVPNDNIKEVAEAKANATFIAKSEALSMCLQKDNLKEVCADLMTVVKNLEYENAGIKFNLAKEREQNRKMALELKRARSDLDDATDRLIQNGAVNSDALQTNYDNLSKYTKTIVADCIKEVEESKQKDDKIANLYKENETLYKENETLRKENETLHNDLDETTAKLISVDEVAETSQLYCRELVHDLENDQAERERNASNESGALEHRGELTASLQQARNDLDETTAKLIEKTEIIEALKNHATEVIDDARERYGDINREYEALKVSYNDISAKLQESNDELTRIRNIALKMLFK